MKSQQGTAQETNIYLKILSKQFGADNEAKNQSYPQKLVGGQEKSMKVGAADKHPRDNNDTTGPPTQPPTRSGALKRRGADEKH